MDLNKDNVKKIIFIIACGLVMLWMVMNYKSVLAGVSYVIGLIKPLILGVAIAFILNVCVRFTEERLFRAPDKKFGKIWQKLRRPLSILISLTVVFGVVMFVITMIVPEFKNATQMLISEFPGYWKNLQSALDGISSKYSLESLKLPDLELNDELFEDGLKMLFKTDISSSAIGSAIDMTSSVISVTASIISGAFDVVMGFVFAIYMLLRKETLARQAKQIIYAFLPKKAADEVLYIGRLSNEMFSNFVTGQCTEAVIIGCLCFLGMMCLRMPYASMVAVLVGFTALIPVFGAFIGTAVGAFLILMVQPIKALWFVLFIIVLQQVEGHLIYPNVVGSSIGLPAIWVMLAVLVGGSAGGMLGMLIGVPLSSVIYCLIGRAAKSRLAQKKISVGEV